ncbi:hypothetical protein AB3X52_10520 [Nocardioides sp. DS6]|uniref:Uncharacterized protein n=1 Tax=Nocardioides eburneus TaxID=3231482 RepID=A0ABV3SYM2_9ACTN
MTSVWVSTWWIWIFGAFIVLAILAGGVQIWAAFMDRRVGRKVENDTDRLHPHGDGDLHEPRE